MTHREFFDKVAAMRACQREHARTRSSLSLRMAKAIESDIDTEIARVQGILNPQPKPKDLFGQ